ncbi:MAG: sodium:alanine symporter family protein, partial [Bacteroidales bacterium]|nr:sodium:alanine symporter family protein [Bacteroidales bacterium]
MQVLNDFLLKLDQYLGSHSWFVYLLVGTGLFFTLYLKFPQIRYFRHAFKITKGKFDRKGDTGDASHFQALATALSGTVGTGNIAGVALAIHLGGPAALFWMLVTAFLGMTTKFVEVLLSHKYRDFVEDGTAAGGTMYYMKKRLNITVKGKTIRTGYVLGGIFAVATILCSFGTGNLPQINNIAYSMFQSFGINQIVTGAILSVLLSLIIIGGIRSIVKVTSRLVPVMAVVYFIGALCVLLYNYSNIPEAIISVFRDVFTGTAATGGFLGAGFAFAFNRGVNRGLFSNEAGQGSAPIAHAAARAHEPVSEGMVAILEPFIDTIVICFFTGITLISSGVWNDKIENRFQPADTEILAGIYSDADMTGRKALLLHLKNEKTLPLFTGSMKVENGLVTDPVTILNARSVAEAITIYDVNNERFTGTLVIENGKIATDNPSHYVRGKSLMHSAALTNEAFKQSFFGAWGEYIVSISLLLFAFSTAISWSYYGDRAVTFLVGSKYVMIYRVIYIGGFFIASFTDTTIIWNLSGITLVLMAAPNLLGILLLHREVKS